MVEDTVTEAVYPSDEVLPFFPSGESAVLCGKRTDIITMNSGHM